MKNTFRKLALILLALNLSLVFGCTADKNEIKSEKELMVSGYVSGKVVEGENNYITLHVLKTPEGETKDLKLKAATKEDYDYFIEDSYYLVSYGKDSLIIKNIQLNNPLGEAITKGAGQGTNVIGEKPIFSTEKFPSKDYTLLDSYEFDINGDGTEETIALYTTAQRDSHGEIMWDDGQTWALVVHGKDKDYELYKNYVQLGSIQFYAFTADDIFHIATVESTTAGLKFVDYVFNKDEGSFTPEIHYDALGNINMLHVSRGY